MLLLLGVRGVLVRLKVCDEDLAQTYDHSGENVLVGNHSGH